MENNQRNSRKRLNSLILLVAFTAVMLIVSTYAWFSSQKNVTIGNLEGKVNVAEGLMVSLDGKNWTNSLELDSTNVVKYLDSGFSLENPYNSPAEVTAGTDGNNNTVPPEMIPASATGTEDLGQNTEMTFYRGTLVNGTELYDMTAVDLTEVTATADLDFSGLFAIDLYLQNSGIDLNGADNVAGNSDDDVQGTTKETLQLNANSTATVITSGGNAATGIQNTMRVALANIDHTEDTSAATQEARTASVHVTASQTQILNAFNGQKITDIAIWEPNAKSHVEYIVNQQAQTPITWNSTIKAMYLPDDTGNTGKFTATDWIPTYALTSECLSASETLKMTGKTGIANIFDWDDTASTGTPAPGVARQIALQTDKTSDSDYSISEDKVRNLVSITSPGANIYQMGNEADAVEFQIYKNEISKIRLYLWLEGQDPDCINYASHGGGIHIDLGLVKGAIAGAVNS